MRTGRVRDRKLTQSFGSLSRRKSGFHAAGTDFRRYGGREAAGSGSNELPTHRTEALFRRVFRLLRAREDRGVAAIEFAIYALGFLMIVAAVVDVGMLLFTASELDAAVSAGAQYAVKNAGSTTLASDIQNIVNNANGTGWATSTVVVNNNDSVATDCYCPSGTPGSWSWGSTVTCGSSCGGGGIAGQFVTITASRAVSPLFPTFGFVASGNLSRSALVETE